MADIFKDARKREFLNAEGADKPLKSPIPHETVLKVRAYRKQRLLDKLAEADCPAILLYEPCNIRYATDVSNMQVWMLHNNSRYAVVGADGHTTAFEYRRSEHLARGYDTVQEVRTAKTWFHMTAGERQPERVEAWADEIDELLRERGGSNRRLAVDRIELPGVEALRKRGITLVEGQPITEMARVIKSAEELELMRWTIRVCEAGMARMYEASEPGKTENEIWAELHFENARSGGEWIETRLLACGPRTNPWFQESSDYVCKDGEMLSFDTDMIGPYGYVADLSRAWTIGHRRMSPAQRELYAAALEQLHHNVGILGPGVTFAEFGERCWPIPDKYLERRYPVALHGVGVGDEWPSVPNGVDFARAYRGTLLPGMTVCIESLIGLEHEGECVKLETQVLITENGRERLDTFPFEQI